MMAFLNPGLLAFLAGVLLPLIIHLLTRDRIQRVNFPATRFFGKRSQFQLRKKNLREMVLLGMRMLACGLMALAFARPIFGPSQTAADGTVPADTARVVVADVSASIDHAGGADALRARAAAALKDLDDTTAQAALIAFSSQPQVVTPFGSGLDAVRRAAEELTPGQGGTELVAALRKADELLANVNARKKEIVLISDLPQASWRSFKGDWRMAPGVKLTVETLKATEGAEDLAIVGAEYPGSLVKDREPRTLAVRVANFSAQDRKDVEVCLTLNGKLIDTQKVLVSARSTASVRFRYVFEQPGDNLGVVSIGKIESAKPGQRHFFNTRIIPRIPTLILNGRPSMNPREDAAFFARMALAPTEDSPFIVQTVPAGEAKLADLNSVSVVILADVTGLPSTLRQGLNALLQRGGGLLFMPGAGTKADTFNREFSELAPCKLRQILQPGNGKADKTEEATTALAKIETEHPIFDIFLRPHHGDFSTVEFYRYWELTESQLSRVLSRFDDGRPALVERTIGAGVSMLMPSPPVDLKWTNLPMRAIFLPYLHQTVRYLAVRTERRAAYAVGDRLPVADGFALKDPANALLKGPDFTATTPGFYALVSAGGQEEFHYAVNRDFAESEPLTVGGEEIVAALEQPAKEADAAAVDEAGRARRDRANVWWYLMAGLGVLLLAELAVGNATPRH
jgi:hypothetical protein